MGADQSGEQGLNPPDLEGDGLTGRQRLVLECIRSSVAERGYPPSMREIGAAVCLTSPSSVKHQLTALERKGFLRRDPNRPRAIEIVLPDDSQAAVPLDAVAGEDGLEVGESRDERPAPSYVP